VLALALAWKVVALALALVLRLLVSALALALPTVVLTLASSVLVSLALTVVLRGCGKLQGATSCDVQFSTSLQPDKNLHMCVCVCV